MSRFLALPWRRVDAHRRGQGLLSAYIDGWVSRGERGILEDHVARCTTCREDLDGLRATVDLMRRVQAVPSPRPLTLAAPSTRGLRLAPWPLPWASVAAGLLLALLVAADAAGVLPQGEPLAAPSAPAQERAAAGQTLAPSAGMAAPPASAPGTQASPATMGARAAQAPIEALGAGTSAEAPPVPSPTPDADAAREMNPWRFVEAFLGVITLALFTLWAKSATRGARS